MKIIMAYELPKLPYDYDALEPHIDEQTMKIHHQKHHAGYTKKLNAALEGADKYALHGKKLSEHSAESLLEHINLLPDSLVEAVANNGGGYVNHKLFWDVMSPEGADEPEGALKAAIEENFESVDHFKELFSDAAKSQFGSGWAWLIVNHDKELEVISTPNQDSPLMSGLTPILGLDVWEHSFYKKFGPAKGEYISAWWNVVNWDEVSRRYGEAVR